MGAAAGSGNKSGLTYLMDKSPPQFQQPLRDPNPWPFGRSELLAGLRRLSGDPSLVIDQIQDFEIPHQQPSIGQVRGLQVNCTGNSGEHTFHLVLKEPSGATRVGTAGVGKREVSVYRNLADQLPLRLPQLVASHPAGEWLVIELTPTATPPGEWSPQNYHLAIQSLASLHDRFWGLGQDLTIYNWLSRPLDADFDIHLQAATTGAEQLTAAPPPSLLGWDPIFPQLVNQLITHAGMIAQALKNTPATFLHGDYWPGNLEFDDQGKLIVFDWQLAGIGPGVLDLVHFTQSSRWWYDHLPVSPENMVQQYRDDLSSFNGHTWSDDQWQALWDYGLLWIFMTNWIDLLAATPESLLETRLPQLTNIWLDPLRAAAHRRKIPGLD